MTIVLGISLSHYGSACIIVDGEVKAAVLEERLSRRKFDAGFPALSIRKVIAVAGIEPGDIDHVAVGTMCEQFDSNLAQDHEYRLATRLLSGAAYFVPLRILETAWLRKVYRAIFYTYNRWQFFRKNTSYFLDLGISPAKIKFYDHHTCHAATAYFASPWRDKVLFFTADGNGDGYCSYVGLGEGDRLETKQAISSIHSLGGLYSRATRFIGMKPWQDEYKVMGLAPWGERKKAAEEVYRKIKRMWGPHGSTYRNFCGYACNSLLAHMNRTLNNPRFDYVAYAVQRVLEETLSEWITKTMAHFQVRKIALSGGIFYNIKANKKIVEQAQPEDIFIFPAAGDESISIGAGYLGYADLRRQQGLSIDLKPITHYYWGEEIETEIEKTIAGLDTTRFEIVKSDAINDLAADLLARNQIVAVCSSRMEYGPRALGNRSILANPSDVRNIERLNNTIKRRDFWMPFALTLLDVCADRYLVNPSQLSSHYMIMGFDTRPEYRDQIIAGIHQADKTVRPQILVRSFNPPFYDLLSAFHQKTGIGALLNTSLNLHGEPMVNLPQEAIGVMLDSDLQHLVLGHYLISKRT
ncbi:hypothetical protein JXQ70_15130 [bacterium]|nr:hypothetical protein [bacterium]